MCVDRKFGYTCIQSCAHACKCLLKIVFEKVIMMCQRDLSRRQSPDSSRSIPSTEPSACAIGHLQANTLQICCVVINSSLEGLCSVGTRYPSVSRFSAGDVERWAYVTCTHHSKSLVSAMRVYVLHACVLSLLTISDWSHSISLVREGEHWKHYDLRDQANVVHIY